MPKAKVKRPPNKGSFQPGHQFGFRKREPTDAVPQTTEQTVLALASLDLSNATVADALGLTVAAFAQLRKDDPAIANALAVGRGKAEDRLMRNLQRLAKNNFIPNISMLKARHGYREADPETDANHNGVTIVIAGADQRPFIEGERVIDDDDTPIPGLNVVEVPVPPKQNGAAPPVERDPEPQQQRSRQQTPEERAAVQEFQDKVGIRTDRGSFTDLQWARFNRTR